MEGGNCKTAQYREFDSCEACIALVTEETNEVGQCLGAYHPLLQFRHTSAAYLGIKTGTQPD